MGYFRALTLFWSCTETTVTHLVTLLNNTHYIGVSYTVGKLLNSTFTGYQRDIPTPDSLEVLKSNKTNYIQINDHVFSKGWSMLFPIEIFSLYTQLQRKVYTFIFVEYSDVSGPGSQGIVSLYSKLPAYLKWVLSTLKITKCILSFGVECIRCNTRLFIWPPFHK